MAGQGKVRAHPMKALRTASAVLGWVWLAGAPVSFLMALGYTEEKWIAVQVGLSGLQGAVLFAVGREHGFSGGNRP